MLFLNEQQVKAAANVEQVISAIRSAFSADIQSSLNLPVRTRLDIGPSILLVMPCHDNTMNMAGVKTVTVNPEYGIHAVYTLFDSPSGAILAVMEADYLTDLRTAATSALATDLLARKDVQTLGIFGTGRQARIHFTVLPYVRQFRRFLVCGSRHSRATEFCNSMRQESGMEIQAVDAETCTRESDVLCTCTTSLEPLFSGHLLHPGTHLNLVGAFQQHTREVDDETIQRARVVVDTYEGALAEAGDVLIPLRKSVISQGHILADLHEIASAKKQIRTSDGDITLFKSLGCALEDLVMARLIWKKSKVDR